MQKSLRFIVCFAALLLSSFAMQAQAPQKFSYQAVVRNASNALVRNSAVGVRISIFQYTAGGTLKFQETHTPTTNDNGLFTIEIGNGTLVSGAINTIDWGDGPYFLRSEVDPLGGTSYTLTADQQLLAVPYALHCDEYQDLADIVTKGNHAGMKQLKDVKDPTEAQDAVTKHYLDSVVAIVSALSAARIKDTAANACISFTWTRNGRTYNSSGIYLDTIEDACGAGCDTVVALRLTIVDGPAVTLGEIGSSLGTTTCAGLPATLSANVTSSTGSLTYLWTRSAGATLLTDNAMAVTTNNLASGANSYTVRVTAAVAGCGSTYAEESITITAAAASAVTLNDIVSSNGATICIGSNTGLSVSADSYTGTVTYEWTATPSGTAGMSATTGNTITAEPTAAASHTYTVVATSHTDGCVDATDTKTITIGVDNEPALTSVSISSEGDETEFCEGESNTLTANTTGLVGTASYQWKKNGVDIPSATNSTYTATEAGSYTVVVTASNGTCANVARTSAAKVMTVNAAALTLNNISYSGAASGSDASVSVAPNSGTLTLAAEIDSRTPASGGSITYAWSKVSAGANELGTSSTLDVATDVTFSDRVYYLRTTYTTDNGCVVTADKTITVSVENPCAAVTTPVIEGDNEVCGTATVDLGVTSGSYNAEYTYTWSNLSTGRYISPTVSTTTIYTVTASNDCGNSATSSGFTVTKKTPFGTPSFINTSSTANSITVQGSMAAHSTMYGTYYFSLYNGASFVESKTSSGTSSDVSGSVTFTGLSTGNTYTVRMYFNKTGTSYCQSAETSTNITTSAPANCPTSISGGTISQYSNDGTRKRKFQVTGLSVDKGSPTYNYNWTHTYSSGTNCSSAFSALSDGTGSISNTIQVYSNGTYAVKVTITAVTDGCADVSKTVCNTFTFN